MKAIFVLAGVILMTGCVVQGGGGGPKPAPPAPAPPPPQNPGGPAKVAVFRPTLDAGFEQGFDANKFYEGWRAEFRDPSIDLCGQDRTDKAQKTEAKGGQNDFLLGDATRVTVHIGSIKKSGYDKKTKKFVEVTLLKYTSTITWSNGTSRSESIEGSIFANPQMLKDLGAKMKALLK